MNNTKEEVENLRLKVSYLEQRIARLERSINHCPCPIQTLEKGDIKSRIKWRQYAFPV